jgi:hypothetical protein
MIAASESWLNPASLGYLAECLHECRDAAMVADLRSFVPPAALREATKRLSQKKREQIKEWVLALNLAREMAV